MSNAFFQLLRKVPLDTRVAIESLAKDQPKVFAELQKRFLQKLKALQGGHRSEIEKVFREEQEAITDILKESDNE